MTADPHAFQPLLDRFGRGWELGKTEDIVGVFTPDAVLIPDPHEGPVRGHDAIRAYWKDLPFTQAEIRFRAGEIFRAGPWFAAEFKVTFRRRRTGEPVDVRGAMCCETRDGLIGEMRLYWQRRVGTRA
jgi:ketosteroid isomerase-like protein